MKNKSIQFGYVLAILLVGKQSFAGCIDDTIEFLRRRQAEGRYEAFLPRYFRYDVSKLKEAKTHRMLEWILRDRKSRGLTAPGIAVDLGCGIGNDSVRLLRAGWRVSCVDEREVALEAIRLQIADEGLDSHFKPFHGNIAEFKMHDADIILKFDALPDSTSEELGRFIVSVRESLNPGGYLALNWASENDPQGLLTRLTWLQRRLLPTRFSLVDVKATPQGPWTDLEAIFQKLPVPQ